MFYYCHFYQRSLSICLLLMQDWHEPNYSLVIKPACGAYPMECEFELLDYEQYYGI